jgi:hypothetical protein
MRSAGEIVTANSLPFLLQCVQQLSDAGIATWVAGGWAEELWGMIEPRPHGDIDLLYPAEDFSRLDSYIASRADIQEIDLKRFSHKCAVLLHGVMIEFFLLERSETGFVTNFFGSRSVLHWPAKTLGHVTLATGEQIPVARMDALHAFRRHFPEHHRAYQGYLAATEARKNT